MKIKTIAIFLILICCLMGAASAAEDVSADVVDVADDSVAVDAVSDDVSDSLESVDDEAVVDESAPAQDDSDDVELEASLDDEVLADEYPSSDSDLLNVLLDNLDYDDVTIHLSSGTWSIPSRAMTMASETDVHIIGENRDNTIFTSYGITQQGSPENYKGTFTWENITFYNAGISLYGINYKFINCKFINYTLELNENEIAANAGNYYLFDYTFVNCDFVNYTQNVITGHNYTNIDISNCNFENITSDTILSTTCTGSGTRYGDGWSQYTDKSSVTLKDSTFNNVDVKGIVKASADAVNNVVTDNNYDFNIQETLVDGEYTYIDVPIAAVDSVVDISSSEKGVVVITLTDNSSAPIAGASFKYTVNGGEEQTATTGDDGKYAITGLTGEVTIAFNYEGNESFKPISDSKFFNFTEEPVVPAKVATKITAPKVSAVYNAAKNLVITLADKDGKALANKKVTVKVGTISKTLTTNAKGQVSLNVATLVPKTYTATVKFAGDDGYLASSLSPKVVVSKAKAKIAAKAKTFKVKVKTKKYTVTLKNNKGKV
ncbi:MAG TPA: hypothetical protein HA355_05920, partial [Methanosphaera sp.]|nr:hypothetical protein [Methanosphaera sp.]